MEDRIFIVISFFLGGGLGLIIFGGGCGYILKPDVKGLPCVIERTCKGHMYGTREALPGEGEHIRNPRPLCDEPMARLMAGALILAQHAAGARPLPSSQEEYGSMGSILPSIC